MAKWKRRGLSGRARSRSARQNIGGIRMFYVYVLKSTTNEDIYVGYTTDLKNRFRLHNAGKVKSTKGYKPWDLIYYESYKGKLDATKREKHLKMHSAKKELLGRLIESLK